MYPNHIQLPVIYRIDYIQPHVIWTPITYNYPWSIALITFNHTLYVPQSHTITRDLPHWLHWTTRYMYPITYNYPWSIALITFNHTLYVPNHIQLPLIYHIDYIQPHVICTQSHTISRDLPHWLHSTTRYMYPITYNYPWSIALITFNHTLYVPNHIQFPVIYHIDYIQLHVICTQSHTITLDLPHWLHSTTRYMYPITYNFPWSTTLITFNHTLYVPNHIQLPVIYRIDYIQPHVICTPITYNYPWSIALITFNHTLYVPQSHTITRDLSHWLHSATSYMNPNHIQLPVIYHIDYIQPHVICTPITYNYPWSITLITFSHMLYEPQSHTITRDLPHWLHSTTRYMYPNHIQLPVIYHIDDILSYTLYVPNHIQLPVIYDIDYIQLHVICTPIAYNYPWSITLMTFWVTRYMYPITYNYPWSITLMTFWVTRYMYPITYNYPWSITLMTFNHTLYVPQSHTITRDLSHWRHSELHVICTQSHTITRDLSHWWHSTTRYMYPNHIQLPVIYHIDYIQPHVICTPITYNYPWSITVMTFWVTRYMYPITYNYPWSMTLITFNYTLYVPQSHTITRDLSHWWHYELHVICTQTHTITRDLSHWLHSTTRYMYPITYNYPWSITLMTFWVTRYMYPITYNYPWSITLMTFNHTLYVPQSHTITRDLPHWLHSTTRYMYPNHIELPVIYRIDYIQPHVICTPITYKYPWSITLITFNHTLYVPNHIQLPVIYHIDYIQPHVICTQSHTITRDLPHWLHSTTRYMYSNHIQLPVIYHIGYIQLHVICTPIT